MQLPSFSLLQILIRFSSSAFTPSILSLSLSPEGVTLSSAQLHGQTHTHTHRKIFLSFFLMFRLSFLSLVPSCSFIAHPHRPLLTSFVMKVIFYSAVILDPGSTGLSLYLYIYILTRVPVPPSGGDSSSSTTGSASPVPNSYDSLEGGSYPGTNSADKHRLIV